MHEAADVLYFTMARLAQTASATSRPNWTDAAVTRRRGDAKPGAVVHERRAETRFEGLRRVAPLEAAAAAPTPVDEATRARAHEIVDAVRAGGDRSAGSRPSSTACRQAPWCSGTRTSTARWRRRRARHGR